MSDATTAKKEPWLLVLMKGQVSNKHAELMGKGPWWLFVLAIFVTSLLAAFPIVNDNSLFAFRSTNPANYPGLYQVFNEIKRQNWPLTIEKGFLKTGAGVPAQTRVGDWLVVFEPAGGSAQALQEAVGSSGTTILKVAFFGNTHLGLIDQSTEKQFDGTYELLSWFSTPNIQTIPTGKLTSMVLNQTATARLPQMNLMTALIMFVQEVLLTVVLGFLLSLSSVHVLGTNVGLKRAAGFLASLRTVGFVALGPALLVALVLSFIPGASGISWVAFTLLYGGRVVVIYMARFRNKPKNR